MVSDDEWKRRLHESAKDLSERITVLSEMARGSAAVHDAMGVDLRQEVARAGNNLRRMRDAAYALGSPEYVRIFERFADMFREGLGYAMDRNDQLGMLRAGRLVSGDRWPSPIERETVTRFLSHLSDEETAAAMLNFIEANPAARQFALVLQGQRDAQVDEDFGPAYKLLGIDLGAGD